MARQMFDDRDDAACEKALGECPAHRGDPVRPLGKGPGPDNSVGRGFGNVKHRRAVDRDPDFAQIMGDEPGDQAARGLGFKRNETRLDHAGGGISPPVGRRQALDAASFLINQNWRVGPSDTLAERADEIAQLIAMFDIAFEDDEAPWIAFAKEGPLFVAEGETRAATNEGLRHGLLRPGPGWRAARLLGDEALAAIAFQACAKRRRVRL
jgi:hypothetical protein